MSCTSRGKFCGACQKEVIDFTKMSWPQIEEIKESQADLCGIFLPEQMDPSLHRIELPNVKSWAFFSSVLVSLNIGSLSAQTPLNKPDESISLIDKVLTSNPSQTHAYSQQSTQATESQTAELLDFPLNREYRKQRRQYNRYQRRKARTWYWSWRFPFVHKKPARTYGIPRWL